MFYARVKIGESNDPGQPKNKEVPKAKINTTSGVF